MRKPAFGSPASLAHTHTWKEIGSLALSAPTDRRALPQQQHCPRLADGGRKTAKETHHAKGTGRAKIRTKNYVFIKQNSQFKESLLIAK